MFLASCEDQWGGPGDQVYGQGQHKPLHDPNAPAGGADDSPVGGLDGPGQPASPALEPANEGAHQDVNQTAPETLGEQREPPGEPTGP